MIKFRSGGHWYQKDGKEQHSADLRIARKTSLYPSVTSIDKDAFKNSFLEEWSKRQLAKAASGNPKQLHETAEDYEQRIYDISMEKVEEAAQFGKELHDGIEHFPQMPLDTSLHPWLLKFEPWFNANIHEVIAREKVLVDHDLGVAGKCDCIARRNGKIIIPDWKSQDVKKDEKGRKKPAFYDSYPRQLAFYAVAYAKEVGMFPDIPDCISVVIDSNEPDEPFTKEWSKDDIYDNYRDFVCGAYLWFSKRNYWPQANGKLTITPSVPMP